jgi:hypothetical protein
MAQAVRNRARRKTVYVEHGIWPDVTLNYVFVHVDACSPRAIQPGIKQCAAYERILQAQGRCELS